MRHRPDRTIVGEVRGGEAFDLLQALTTGHAGRCRRSTPTPPARPGPVRAVRGEERRRAAVPSRPLPDCGRHRRRAPFGQTPRLLGGRARRASPCAATHGHQLARASAEQPDDIKGVIVLAMHRPSPSTTSTMRPACVP
ncbi:MAG: ATPase, T2SS/T4P/T4SS family [Acidobacteriota bacterium]